MPKQASGLSPEVLRAALEGLEGQLQRIEDQIKQVQSLMGSGRTGSKKTANTAASGEQTQNGRRGRRRRRTLSPEARARISAAQKKRWAAAKRSK